MFKWISQKLAEKEQRRRKRQLEQEEYFARSLREQAMANSYNQMLDDFHERYEAEVKASTNHVVWPWGAASLSAK